MVALLDEGAIDAELLSLPDHVIDQLCNSVDVKLSVRVPHQQQQCVNIWLAISDLVMCSHLFIQCICLCVLLGSELTCQHQIVRLSVQCALLTKPSRLLIVHLFVVDLMLRVLVNSVLFKKFDNRLSAANH